MPILSNISLAECQGELSLINEPKLRQITNIIWWMEQGGSFLSMNFFTLRIFLDMRYFDFSSYRNWTTLSLQSLLLVSRLSRPSLPPLNSLRLRFLLNCISGIDRCRRRFKLLLNNKFEFQRTASNTIIKHSLSRLLLADI